MDGRKIYYSFHDIPGTSAGYGGNDYYGGGHGIKFSRTEIIHILIAMATLTVAFSFVFVPYPPLKNIASAVRMMPLSFLAIATAFFCHETAHKYMGQKYGYWSEFRMFPQGLLLALALGVTVGIVFAAPGAVQIWGRPSREESGRISAAGPATNIIISVIFSAVGFATGGTIASVAYFVAYINAFLALFNLLPFGPLDGTKVFRWRVDVWLALMAAGAVLFIMLMAPL